MGSAFIHSGGEEGQDADLLKKRLHNLYIAELPEEIASHEPVVRVRYSETEEFRNGSYWFFTDADAKTTDLNRQLSVSADDGNHKSPETLLVGFTICMAIGGELKTFDTQVEIGEGTGGLLQCLRSQAEDRSQDEFWLRFLKSRGEEKYQSYMTELQNLQENILPYLQQYSCLPERKPLETPVVRNTQELPEAGKKLWIQPGAAPASMPAKAFGQNHPDRKPTIHDRMNQKRKMITSSKEKPPEKPERELG